MNKYSVGVDISKNDFHACFSGIDSHQQVKVLRSTTFKNNKDGFSELAKWINDTGKEKTIPTPLLPWKPQGYILSTVLYFCSKVVLIYRLCCPTRRKNT